MMRLLVRQIDLIRWHAVEPRPAYFRVSLERSNRSIFSIMNRANRSSFSQSSTDGGSRQSVLRQANQERVGSLSDFAVAPETRNPGARGRPPTDDLDGCRMLEPSIISPALAEYREALIAVLRLIPAEVTET